MSVDAKIMTVVSAIKQSLQTSGGPGSSVNSHPNPFFINVTGEVNLKHAAELIIQRLEEYEAALKAMLDKRAKAEAKVAEVITVRDFVGDKTGL
jgi:cell shape-determining protein MreC